MANKIDYSQFKKDEILALDIATHTGFYAIAESGEWDFTESKKRNDNKEHLHFRSTLIEFIKEHNIKIVVAEDLIYMPGRFSATRKLGEYRGVLLEVCDELNLPEPYFVAPTHIKMTATGKGRATKEEVMAGVSQKWKIDVKGQDNLADAIAAYYTFCNKFKIRQ